MAPQLSTAPPQFPPPGLLWGHALYMAPGSLTLADRTRVCRLGAIKRDIRRITEIHRGVGLSPAAAIRLLSAELKGLHPERRQRLTP